MNGADKNPALITIGDLHVTISGERGSAQVLEGVNLSIARGEVLALVGESGSGKSTTALAITRLLPANARISQGEILFAGKDLAGLAEKQMNAVRASGISLLFQQPRASLDPTCRVGVQVVEAYRQVHRVSDAQARARAVSLLAAVGIPEPELRARAFVHELSGGMAQRVAIAAALSSDPDLLIADEPTTALDVSVQAQILALLTELNRSRGLALLLITHDLGPVASIAHRVAVMYAGRVMEIGARRDIVERPRHPYSQALLKASALIPDAAGLLPAIPGVPPRPNEITAGCRFLPRCPVARRLGIEAACAASEPPLALDANGHGTRCFAVDSAKAGGQPEASLSP